MGTNRSFRHIDNDIRLGRRCVVVGAHDQIFCVLLPAFAHLSGLDIPANMSDVSALGPIDPSSIPEAETEKSAPWIVRKLVGVSLA